MRLDLVTGPTTEPITLAEVKTHLRVTQDLDDSLLTASIKAARQEFEEYTERQILAATWRLYLPDFPGYDSGYYRRRSNVLYLPNPPLVSVDSVKYLDADGVEQTWADTEYDTVTPSGPYARQGWIRPKPFGSWPVSFGGIEDAVRIEFEAGTAEADAGVKLALLKMVGGLHEEPTSMIVGAMVNANPALKRLLDSFRFPVLA